MYTKENLDAGQNKSVIGGLQLFKQIAKVRFDFEDDDFFFFSRIPWLTQP